MARILSKALSDSRTIKWRPASREEVLAKLLVRRAEAHQAGLTELEDSLREQIKWALPMRKAGAGPDDALNEGDGRSDAPLDDRL